MIYFLLTLISLWTTATHAGTIRAALELGSSTYKLQVAEVDSANQKIIRIINRAQVAVDLDKNFDAQTGKIKDTALTFAEETVRDFLKRAANAHASECSAVAIQIFRRLNNAEEILAKYRALDPSIQLKTSILSQSDELKLAYESVNAELNPKKKPLIIWDIEQAGTQMIRKDESGAYVEYQTLWGSRLASEKLGKPNFSVNENRGKVFVIKTTEALNRDAKLKKMLEVKHPLYVGIGSIQNQVILPYAVNGKKSVYNIHDVSVAVQSLFERNEAEVREYIGSKTPETDLSDLLLAYNFLLQMAPSDVQVVNVDLTAGVLISPVE